MQRHHHDVIVVGGSAGSLKPLQELLAAQPANLPASIFVVVHRSAASPSYLDLVLDAAGPLRASLVREGERFLPGHIYVATPDCHLLVGDDHVHSRRGPRENRTRPAIDPLFRSAAVNCSTRVIAVLLSGMLNDGTAGLQAVKACGGLVLVQDPAEAQASDMPRSALEHVAADHVGPVRDLAALLPELVALPAGPPVPAGEKLRIETVIAYQEMRSVEDQLRLGKPSSVTCPECHGSMVLIEDGGLIRFRCHTGHAFTAETLVAAQGDIWEQTLYDALRIQQEQGVLARQMAANARGHGHEKSARDFDDRARSYDEGAQVIHQLLVRGPAPDAD